MAAGWTSLLCRARGVDFANRPARAALRSRGFQHMIRDHLGRRPMQRKIVLAALAALFSIAPAQAQDVKLGGLFGITGPIASLVPPIVESARLAVKQVNDQGGILKGGKLEMIVADSQCNP